MQSGIDFAEMARVQQTDPEMHAYRMAGTNLRFEDVPVGNTSITLLTDVSNGRQRPVVPEPWYLNRGAVAYSMQSMAFLTRP